MKSLTLHQITFTYEHSSLAIFENLSLEFDKGWSCIVGSNGIGKSTLLKLIANDLVAQSGFISGNECVHYCKQSTEYPPENFETFMFTFTGETYRIRELLHIQEEWCDRWKTLSHGERKRVQIALALYEKPDILLVDEPTNHLDTHHRNIVTNALQSFNNIGIVVSHDRELLEKLSRSTLILKNQNVHLYKSSFSHAMTAYNKERAFLEKTGNRHSREIKKIEEMIQIQKEKVSRSKKILSKKGVDKKDSDSRNKINAAKLTGKDKKEGRMISKPESKQNHLHSKRVKIEKSYTLGIAFEASTTKNLSPSR